MNAQREELGTSAYVAAQKDRLLALRARFAAEEHQVGEALREVEEAFGECTARCSACNRVCSPTVLDAEIIQGQLAAMMSRL